jgi:hypothetical protein
MPKYGKATGESDHPKNWQVRPHGLRGLFIIRNLWPYLSGDELKLDLHVKSDKQTSKEYEFGWWLWQRNQDGSEKKYDEQTMKITVNRGLTKIPLKTHLLQYKGEYRLLTQLTSKDQTKPHTHPQTLMNFQVQANDEYRTTITIGLMSGLIGAVIGALLVILFQRGSTH